MSFWNIKALKELRNDSEYWLSEWTYDTWGSKDNQGYMHTHAISLTWTCCLDCLWPVSLAWLTLLNTAINMTRLRDQSCLLLCPLTYRQQEPDKLREGPLSLTVISPIRTGGPRVFPHHTEPFGRALFFLPRGRRGLQLLIWLPLAENTFVRTEAVSQLCRFKATHNVQFTKAD